MFKPFFLLILLFSFCSNCYSKTSLIENYSNIAEAKYKDSWKLAKTLLEEVNKFLDNTTESNLHNVKQKWLEARKIYQQTEVFRFGNPIVDDWEGKVNAWPLDEGLIDYVDTSNYYPSENDFSNFNIIANKYLKVEGNLVNASIIDTSLLENRLHEIGGNEANVATGYHAIEFLLWGQDLNGTGPGKGKRPYTDLLLHDMGEKLADVSLDNKVTNKEWKTPALWGIGLAKEVNPRATFLHDGRADTILEAIMWHGGEAQSSINYLVKNYKEELDKLVKFVESL